MPKYRQPGYQDFEKPAKKEKKPVESRPRPQPHQHLSPRTPRMVGSVQRARCAECGTVLAHEFDATEKCPKCQAELHSCKQCRHFDSGAKFECTQPIPEAIPKKSAKNRCKFFEFRVTIEKDTSPASHAPASAPASDFTHPRPSSGRQAFDNLFKK